MPLWRGCATVFYATDAGRKPKVCVLGGNRLLRTVNCVAGRAFASLRAFLDLDVTEAPPNHLSAHAASDRRGRSGGVHEDNGWRERVWCRGIDGRRRCDGWSERNAASAAGYRGAYLEVVRRWSVSWRRSPRGLRRRRERVGRFARVPRRTGRRRTTVAVSAGPGREVRKGAEGRWAHLAHKAEHGIDLETGAILSVTVPEASEGKIRRRSGDADDGGQVWRCSRSGAEVKRWSRQGRTTATRRW